MKRASCFFLVFLLWSIGPGLQDAWGSPPLPSPAKLKYLPMVFSPPKPERVELPNGLVLYILEDRELPVVCISAAIRAGAVHDPPGKEGLADLISYVMRTGGTSSLSGDDIDETLEFMASTVSLSAGMDSGGAEVFSLKKNFDRTLEMFAQILMKPAFEEKKLALAKGLKIEEIRRVGDVPQKLAFREFRKVMYRGNPRGRLATEASVGGIDRGDLARFHGQFYGPRNIMMAVAGDIRREEVVTAFNRHFGAWKSGEAAAPVPPPVSKTGGPIYFIHKDGPQSTVISGYLAPEKGSPEFFPFTLLDFIVGSGGFQSRIFQEIRNNLGLAYSTGSFYDGRRGYGIFGAYAITQSQSTGRVLTKINEILDDVRTRGVRAGEMRWAKNAIVNSFIFSFDSTRSIAAQRMMIEFHGLPADFLDSYRRRIEEVSAESVRATAQTHLRPGESTTLVVGDEKNFDRPLSAFGEVQTIEWK